MSQKVSTGTVTAIVVVVVIVLGIIAWKVLGGHGTAPTQAEQQTQMQLEMQSHAAQQRSGGAPGAMPPGPGGPGP